MSTPLQARLELLNITKTYPGVVANNAVNLTVQSGEIHAVLGENGAGKSTLMRIIYGAQQPDSGQILIDGQPIVLSSPQQAREHGIAMVFQHFSLFETLTVAQNVWLGLDRRYSLAQVAQMITDKAQAYGLPIDPQRTVHTLSVGEMQRVEIIRALLSNPRLLILDEPTSVLTPQAVESLFDVLRQLAAEGCSILYISHKLHEIRSLCHHCTVLRNGQVTGTCRPQEESNASLSRMMIGDDPPALPARKQQNGAVVFELRGLSLSSADPFGVDLHDLHLQLRAGEIVGLAGVSGNGQRELLQALSGEDTRAQANTITLLDQAIGHCGPAQRRAQGLHFVPEERLGRGAVPELDLMHNLLLTRTESVACGGWLNMSALRQQAQAVVQKMAVKSNGIQAAAQSLSGGNLQKFIVGREIGAQPKVLILAQPTWGVDVGACAQIHQQILALRETGCAILLVSEELDELFALSDRLLVLARGRFSPCLPINEASVERIGLWMSGMWHDDDALGVDVDTGAGAESMQTAYTPARTGATQHLAER